MPHLSPLNIDQRPSTSKYGVRSFKFKYRITSLSLRALYLICTIIQSFTFIYRSYIWTDRERQMQMPSYVDISILFSPRLYIFSIVGKLIKCRLESSQMTTRHCAPRHLNRIEDTAVFASRPCSDCFAGLLPNARAKRGFDSVALTCLKLKRKN